MLLGWFELVMVKLPQLRGLSNLSQHLSSNTPWEEKLEKDIYPRALRNSAPNLWSMNPPEILHFTPIRNVIPPIPSLGLKHIFESLEYLWKQLREFRWVLLDHFFFLQGLDVAC